MQLHPALPLLLCVLVLSVETVADSKMCRGKRKNSRRCRNSLTQGQEAPKALQDGPDDGDNPERSTAWKVGRPQWRDEPPKDKIFIQRDGSQAVFKCNAVGRPQPKVTWFKDGAEMKVKSNKKYRKSKWKLEISEVTIGDSGNYTCKVHNSEGSLEWTYTLRVLENKPISDINIIERPKNQTAHVGDTVVFMCRSDTWPAPSIYWARKPVNKLVVEIVQMENNTLAEVLVLHNVRKSDAGDYTCYIGNNLSNLRLTATLTVIEEGESLPFEPRCALHIRRQILVDSTYGCQTTEPVEMNYCMGSCGRSYYIPTMFTTDDDDHKLLSKPLNQTCQCCVGDIQGIRIVPLQCPSGETRNGFFPLLTDCTCSLCTNKVFPSAQSVDDTSSPSP